MAEWSHWMPLALVGLGWSLPLVVGFQTIRQGGGEWDRITKRWPIERNENNRRRVLPSVLPPTVPGLAARWSKVSALPIGEHATATTDKSSLRRPVDRELIVAAGAMVLEEV